MAISVSKQFYTDLSSITDPFQILQSIDYDQDPMEFRITTIDDNITRTIYEANTNDLQDLVDQSINFVDSQTNNQKEIWPTEYNKPDMLQPQQIEVDNIANLPRKRRMYWESLDLGSTNNSSASDGISVPKIANVVSVVVGKDRERRKTSNGRLGWSDDIDFDLNGELTNNGYLNNEAFLSLSSALTMLKHETPSPSSDQQRIPKSPQDGGTTIQAVIRENIVNSNQQQQQQQQHQQSQHNNIIANNNGSNIKSNNNNNLNDEQHQNNLNAKNNNIQHEITENNGTVKHLGCESPTHENDQKNDKFKKNQSKFQYVLAASTSIATKSNEDTLTYLNQGQSYEIKLKKLGDLSTYRGKILKSIIKICFHERRLQYMEKEQMLQWQASRPGERIVEIDVPLSYGLCHVSQSTNPNLLNTVEVLWDPMKEVGVYIQVNCISTEFTPKKHGGEKGVPFRIQVETYLEKGTNNDGVMAPIHAAACQIKVFKLKGADRKHKQDREKIQKRTRSEQEKFQPSYECTILTEIPNETITPPICYSPEHISNRPNNVSPLMPRSPVKMNIYENMIYNPKPPSHPIGINSVSSSNSNMKIVDQNNLSPQQIEIDDFTTPVITKDSTPAVLSQWMSCHRLSQHISTFTNFSGADVLRMSKEDIIQICGVADGIRMYNNLQSKSFTPRLTIYVSFDSSSYHAVYLHSTTIKELTQKLCKLPGFYECVNGNCDNNGFPVYGLHSKYSGSGSNIYDSSKIKIYVDGPSGIHVLVTDEVLSNIKEDSLFTVETQNGKILMKAVYKNELN